MWVRVRVRVEPKACRSSQMAQNALSERNRRDAYAYLSKEVRPKRVSSRHLPV